MSDGTKIALAVGGVGLVALFLLRGSGGGGLGGGLLGGASTDALGVAPGAAPPATSAGGTGVGSKILSFGKTAINPLTPIKLAAQLTSTSAHYTAAAVSGGVGAVKGVATSIAGGVSSVIHSIF